jgi:hypothetical protein
MSNENTDKKLGFIILRHVNSDSTNEYWIHCYKCIRKYYPENYIIIIDDNSNYEHVSNEKLYKTAIINSEYHKRGELLPYYYYLKIKLFDNAVIIHDSVFINQYIDMTVDKYKIIWEFENSCCPQPADETKMINVFNDKDLLDFYNNKPLWKGCFGAMTIINHDFLSSINNKYDLSKLLDLVLTRYNRCSFERVLACLLQKEYKKEVLLGNIHKYVKWGVKFNDKDKYNHLPIIKIWSGR